MPFTSFLDEDLVQKHTRYEPGLRSYSPAEAKTLRAAVICFGTGLIRKSATEVAVSNRRVLVKSGFISRKTIEVTLSKVENLGVEESALGRMLGYGNVIARGTGGTCESFERIAKPEELSRRFRDN